MDFKTDISLKSFNTFGLDVNAHSFFVFHNKKEIKFALRESIYPLLILGGGSNILLTKAWKGTVLKNEIKGIEIVRNLKKSVWIGIGGGEEWHDLVLWSINNDFGGIENLSLIPGTVGAAPIQNIGAYGVELKDVFVKLEAIHIQTGKKKVFYKNDCQFGYRNSIFKNSEKGKYVIYKVILKLQKAPHHLNMNYGAIKSILTENHISNPTIRNLSNAIIQIRQQKLPDPKEIGNSGSFFKNPVIGKEQFTKLQVKFPNIVFYKVDDGYKIPAGWLIEQCGWKGKVVGNTGCHKNQALVLVNYGNATGEEIYAHALRVIDSVFDTFGIRLSMEVNVV